MTPKDGEVTIQTASYDGLNRRVEKVVSNSGNLDGTTVFYYNDRWQVLETRDAGGAQGGSFLGNLVMQVYPGTQYVDEVVGLRLKDRGRVYVHQAEGDQGGSLKDWNVTDLTDLTGRVLERYYYSPYGELEVAADRHPFDWDGEFAFADEREPAATGKASTRRASGRRACPEQASRKRARGGDGDVDEEDIAACTTGGDCWGNYSGDCKRLDADADGDIDAADYTAVSAYAATLSTETKLQRTPAADRSLLGNVFFHQGLVLDPELGSYQNRNRQYAAELQRFLRRDTRQYVDGANLYGSVGSNPLVYRDPFGTTKTCSDVQWFGGPDSGRPCKNTRRTDDTVERVAGCTGCDGENGVLACVNPNEPATSGYPNDSSGNCKRDASGVDPIGKCACEHEQTHRDQILASDQGCGGNSSKCNQRDEGTSAICCDKCYESDSEVKAYGAQVDCLNNIPPSSVPADRLKQAKKGAQELKEYNENRLKKCEDLLKEKCAKRRPEGCQ